MKNLLSHLWGFLPLIAVFTGYVVFAWGIIVNRLRPSYETALGVAYFAMFGMIFVFVGIFFAVIYKYSPYTWRLSVTLIASLLYLVLLVLAEGGRLSVVG